MNKKIIVVGVAFVLVAILLFSYVEYFGSFAQAQVSTSEPFDLSQTNEWSDHIDFEREGKKHAFYVEKWNSSEVAWISMEFDPSMGAEFTVETYNIRNLSIDLPMFFGAVKGEIVESGDQLTDYEYREIIVDLNAPLVVHMENDTAVIENLVFVGVSEPTGVGVISDNSYRDFTDWTYRGDNVYTNVPEGTDEVYVFYEGNSFVSSSSFLSSYHPWLPLALLLVGVVLLLVGAYWDKDGGGSLHRGRLGPKFVRVDLPKKR